MKKSPIFPRYESGNYTGSGFDPHLEFSQYLEEARKHANEEEIQAPWPYPKAEKIIMGEEKNKKSWKSYLFSWLKIDKKSKPHMEPASSSHISKPRRGSVSGPLYGSGGQAESTHRRPTSGPLAGLFNSKRSGGVEIAYMCLDQPSDVQAYGPVYLVT
ncbi:hypothetical protein HHK36_025343 [Tetracentron sinense]|uniref:Uncharacterized protein n=1 Tax=Tetracentron sinense TaxID=13715 RepID=A0A835D318_TETSI|nr:hypothetical protein HHK36_025343 [Tetracentron sinense]